MDDFLKIMNDPSRDSLLTNILVETYNKRNIEEYQFTEGNILVDAADLPNVLLNKISIEKVVLGNIYNYIKSSQFIYTDTGADSLPLKYYLFKPNIQYEKYMTTNGSHFNNYYQSLLEYYKIVSNCTSNLSKEKFTLEVFDDIWNHLVIQRPTGVEENIYPRSHLIYDNRRINVMDNKLDPVFLACLNKSIGKITEDAIMSTFKKVARLNIAVIDERLKEYSDSAGLEMKEGLLSALEEFKTLNFKASISLENLFDFEEHYNNIKENISHNISVIGDALGDVGEGIKESFNILSAYVANLNTGMYLRETLEIIRDNIDAYKLDSLPEISEYIVLFMMFRFFGIDGISTTTIESIYEDSTKIASLYRIISDKLSENNKFTATLTTDQSVKIQLGIPDVKLTQGYRSNGTSYAIASWEKVEHASEYEFEVTSPDGTIRKEIFNGTEMSIGINESIRVRAISRDPSFESNYFSEPIIAKTLSKPTLIRRGIILNIYPGSNNIGYVSGYEYFKDDMPSIINIQGSARIAIPTRKIIMKIRTLSNDSTSLRRDAKNKYRYYIWSSDYLIQEI